jgi:hypothetical protein
MESKEEKKTKIKYSKINYYICKVIFSIHIY